MEAARSNRRTVAAGARGTKLLEVTVEITVASDSMPTRVQHVCTSSTIGGGEKGLQKCTAGAEETPPLAPWDRSPTEPKVEPPRQPLRTSLRSTKQKKEERASARQ